MTGPALTVDSTQLLRAAAIVHQASSAFIGFRTSISPDPSPLAPESLGASEIARATVTAATYQLSRAQDAGEGLAALGQTVAAGLQLAAVGFEVLESTPFGGPR